jgi:hypothetical protein
LIGSIDFSLFAHFVNFGDAANRKKGIILLKTITHSVLSKELTIMERSLALLIGLLDDTKQTSALKLIA